MHSLKTGQRQKGGVKLESKATTNGNGGGVGGGFWSVPNGGAVRVSHDVGHFAVDFDAHSERLEIFNLGTDLIEMTGSVPIDSPFSSFHSVIDRERGIAIDSKYKSLQNVAVEYLFETIGRLVLYFSLKFDPEILSIFFTLNLPPKHGQRLDTNSAFDPFR